MRGSTGRQQRAASGTQIGLRATGSVWPPSDARCRGELAPRFPGHASNKTPAGAMRENAHASEHRVRQAVLRHDLQQGFLLGPALRPPETRHRPPQRDVRDLPELLRNVLVRESQCGGLRGSDTFR